MSRGARHDRVKTPRERRCVVSGQVRPEAELLRVALGPDGVLVPDVAARLPGRGGWVSADRASVEKAVAKRLFSRALERQVEAPPDLADRFEALLEARALSLLGLARRSGTLASGFDAVRLGLKAKARPGLRIEASDGARDGREKLDRLAEAIHPGLLVVDRFSSDALGAALGRDRVVHALMAEGSEARGLRQTLQRLAGFAKPDPDREDRREGAENG